MDGYLTKPISGVALAEAIAGGADAAADTGQQDQPVLDRARLAELAAAMGEAGVQRMVAQFVRDLPDLVVRLTRACDAKDTSLMLQIAHEGAGAAAMVGAVAFGQHLMQIEDVCRIGSQAEAEALVPQVAALSQAAIAALQA